MRPSGDQAGAPLTPARADTFWRSPGAQRLHVDLRHLVLERHVREPAAVRRPGRRHDRLGGLHPILLVHRRRRRRRSAGNAGCRRPARRGDVGDARREHAAHAGQLLVDPVGHAMRACAQRRAVAAGSRQPSSRSPRSTSKSSNWMVNCPAPLRQLRRPPRIASRSIFQSPESTSAARRRPVAACRVRAIGANAAAARRSCATIAATSTGAPRALPAERHDGDRDRVAHATGDLDAQLGARGSACRTPPAAAHAPQPLRTRIHPHSVSCNAVYSFRA